MLKLLVFLLLTSIFVGFCIISIHFFISSIDFLEPHFWELKHRAAFFSKVSKLSIKTTVSKHKWWIEIFMGKAQEKIKKKK